MSEQSKKFIEAIQKSYSTEEEGIYLGAGVLNGEIIPESKVILPLSMMNRHGMIAGATGSGKTRTLQVLAEQLSRAGVPVFMSDIKGDLSGLGKEGIENDKIKSRVDSLGISFEPSSFPIELYSLSGKKGAQMRATVSEFGPILLSKVLDLNDTQTGVLAILFKYADDKKLPIVDLGDLKKVLLYLSEGQGMQEIKSEYGTISASTSGTILRKIVAQEQMGIGNIFGEKSFDISDLFNKVDGRGVISLMNVSDMQDKPMVFSTFMLSLLAEIYQTMPEVGDVDKPKLVFFLDEAHLLFKDAGKAFLNQVEQIIRLIRSKGVGVFFCSQMAQDISPTVLSQLGNRFQHVLRAFTPQDSEALKQTVKTFPRSSFYDIEETLTQMGIGQALITVLNEKGIPTEVAHTHLIPPGSLMGALSENEYEEVLKASEISKKYSENINTESAFEILEKRIHAHAEAKTDEIEIKPRTGGRPEKSTFEKVLENPVTKQIGKEIVRGVFGMLFSKSRWR